jgi:hypothetical protein
MATRLRLALNAFSTSWQFSWFASAITTFTEGSAIAARFA